MSSRIFSCTSGWSITLIGVAAGLMAFSVFSGFATFAGAATFAGFWAGVALSALGCSFEREMFGDVLPFFE